MNVAHRRAWADEQAQVLIGLGIPPAEARSTVAWVLDHAPPGADLDTWMPSPELLNDDIDTLLAVSSATPVSLLQRQNICAIL